MRAYQRLHAEAGLRLQLSSIKPDIREICKNLKPCHFSKILRNRLFMKTCYLC